MAKSKIPKVEELSGYFFISVQGAQVEVVYHDNTDRGLALGAAFASALQTDDKLYDLLGVAMLTAIEDRNKVKLTKKKSAPKKKAK